MRVSGDNPVVAYRYNSLEHLPTTSANTQIPTQQPFHGE
jgi:hypothetical protein